MVPFTARIGTGGSPPAALPLPSGVEAFPLLPLPQAEDMTRTSERAIRDFMAPESKAV
jgi:hypothetical protein